MFTVPVTNTINNRKNHLAPVLPVHAKTSAGVVRILRLPVSKRVVWRLHRLHARPQPGRTRRPAQRARTR